MTDGSMTREQMVKFLKNRKTVEYLRTSSNCQLLFELEKEGLVKNITPSTSSSLYVTFKVL